MLNAQDHISRRTLLKTSVLAATLLPSTSPAALSAAQPKRHPIRLGGPASGKTPEAWVKAVKDLGYSAAYCPVGPSAPDDVVKAYAKAAKQANIIIAEVGAWSNPISPDDKTRNAALEKCRTHLALADRIGANCCVNIAGSRGKSWAGPSPHNLTKDTFDLIVEATRSIIDHVKPTRTYFTLEMMPWAYPDSPDSYVRLLKAMDRKRFAVHLDPVNIVTSPQRYYNTGALIRECFAKLGPYLKSCHGKDILLRDKLTTHLDEVRPGLGGLDYTTFLTELSKLPDIPLMLEHLSGAEQYRLAAQHVRSVGKKAGVSFA